MHHRKLLALLATLVAVLIFAGTAQAYRGYGYARHYNGTPFVGTVFAYNYTTGAVGMTGSDPTTGWFTFRGLNDGTWYNFWICTREGAVHNFDAVVFQQPPWDQEHDLHADSSDPNCF